MQNLSQFQSFFTYKINKTNCLTYAYADWSERATASSFLPSTIIFVSSGLNNLHEYPILIAVSILSPVKTQI